MTVIRSSINQFTPPSISHHQGRPKTPLPITAPRLSITMAGGAALNIFRMGNSGLPKAVLNRHLWLAVLTFGLMGAARGVDEGLITGIFNTDVFKRSLGLDNLDKDALADVKGDVSSMVQLGSIPGALLAFLACDRYGRVWATRQLCVLWLVGTFSY